MTVDEIERMRYEGGGYFRVPGPKGVGMPIIHAPELREILLREIQRLREALQEAQAG